MRCTHLCCTNLCSLRMGKQQVNCNMLDCNRIQLRNVTAGKRRRKKAAHCRPASRVGVCSTCNAAMIPTALRGGVKPVCSKLPRHHWDSCDGTLMLQN